MSAIVISLHPEWVWVPTWEYRFDPETGDPKKQWTGWETLYTTDGEQVVLLTDGRGWGIGSGGSVTRQALPPKREPPTDAECKANRERKLAQQRARERGRQP